MNLTLLRSLGVAAVSVMSLTSLSVSAADETAPETESPVVIAIPNFDDDPENGIEHPLVEFIRTWEGLSGRELLIERFPFKRSMKMATSGQADFHFPLIRDPEVDAAGLPFDYSSTRITTVNFVLYTREGETIDMEHPENYRLTTHGGHGNHMPLLGGQTKPLGSSRGVAFDSTPMQTHHAHIITTQRLGHVGGEETKQLSGMLKGFRSNWEGRE